MWVGLVALGLYPGNYKGQSFHISAGTVVVVIGLPLRKYRSSGARGPLLTKAISTTSLDRFLMFHLFSALLIGPGVYAVSLGWGSALGLEACVQVE